MCEGGNLMSTSPVSNYKICNGLGSDKVYDIRRRLTLESACNIIFKSNVPDKDKVDLMMSLSVKKQADIRAFSEWHIENSRRYNELIDIIDNGPTIT